MAKHAKIGQTSLSKENFSNSPAKLIALSAILGVILSFSAFGLNIIISLKAGDGLTSAVTNFAVGIVLLGAISYLLLRVATKAKFISLGKKASNLLALNPKCVVALSAIILVCWIPAAVMMSPFHAGPDTIAQLLWSQGYPAFDPSSREVLNGYTMSDHHPFLDTLIYGFFYDIGQALGNATIGMQIYCYLQLLIMASVFGYMVCWMKERGVPSFLCIFALLFFAINPFFPMHLMQVVKDITSMPFFIAWIIAFTDLVLEVKNSKKITVRRVLVILLLVILGSLMRKTLLYIMVPSLLVLALYSLFKRKGSFAPILISLAVPALVVLIIVPKLIFPVLGVSPGGSQETISVPIQQVSCIVVKNEGALSDEDKKIIDAVLPYEKIPELYNLTSADAVKDSWKRDSTDSDKLAFLGLWIRLGLAYPAEYINCLTYQFGYWFRGVFNSDSICVWWGWDEMGSSSLFPAYKSGEQTEGQKALYEFVHETLYASNPITEFFFDEAVYVLWIPAFAFMLALLRPKKTRNLILFLPILLSMAVLFTVPAFQTRYGFNMIFLAPYIISIAYIRRYRYSS